MVCFERGEESPGDGERLGAPCVSPKHTPALLWFLAEDPQMTDLPPPRKGFDYWKVVSSNQLRVVLTIKAFTDSSSLTFRKNADTAST